jgi:metal-sulfur cluster biosynthetic enzyme
MSQAGDEGLKEAILSKLREVIDPETNVDVIRMRLVEELEVSPSGSVRYTFRPSSALCPIAVFLLLKIKEAVGKVPGVMEQRIKVAGYVAAEELTRMINEED